jgi:alpha-ketoglutarate-dependent taurine dioxygenase
MPYETIAVQPFTPTMGAEVGNVDLLQPLAEQTQEELNTALLEHLVLFFRHQDLTFEQHKQFGRHFGDLHILPTVPGPEGHRTGSGTMPYGKTYPYERAGVTVVFPVTDFSLHTSDK